MVEDARMQTDRCFRGAARRTISPSPGNVTQGFCAADPHACEEGAALGGWLRIAHTTPAISSTMPIKASTFDQLSRSTNA